MNENKENWFACLMNYSKGYKCQLAISVLFSVLSIVFGVVPYFCVYKLIESFILKTITSEVIVYWSVFAAVCYGAKVLLFGLSTGLSHYAAYHILERLRIKVTDKFMNVPLGDVMNKSIGEIKNTIVDKIEAIEPPLAHMIPEGSGHIVVPIISFIALFIVDFRMALASLVTLPLAMICMVVTYKLSEKNFDKYNESNNFVNSVIVEYVEGIEVIKAFGNEGTSYEKFSTAIQNYRKFILKWLSSTWVSMKLSFALLPSTLLGVLPVGLYLAYKEILSPAEVALCVMLSMSMIGSLSRLEVFSEGIREMEFTIEALQKFLNMKELTVPKERAELSEYGVNVENVCFSYTGKEEVLHSINMELKQGSFVALVGPSGGGKSTVAKLIARFWDVTEGKISIGGINIKDMPLSQLADTVSFVAQDNFLFRCSIKENIRLGNPNATDEEVYAAAKAAQCDEFIGKLEKGYDTPAGEAGNRLSGGEKQRIAISRMILKNAPIIILDEATAFTDPENEAQIQKSLSILTKGKTVLVIAHRLSTIKNADNIIVLKNGDISAQGSHDELLNISPLYRNMWKAHIGAKAWAVSMGKGAPSNV